MGSEARIDQLEVRSPESCLYPGIRSQECPHRHDLFMLEYSKCAILGITFFQC